MTKTIGFIGLGVMGQGMVRNLLKAGFSVKGYNRTKEKGLPLEQDGAVIVDTIQEAVTDVDVVISIVGYPQDVEEIYLAEDGILASANPGTIVIDMTTSSPALAIRIAEQAAQNRTSRPRCTGHRRRSRCKKRDTRDSRRWRRSSLRYGQTTVRGDGQINRPLWWSGTRAVG